MAIVTYQFILGQNVFHVTELNGIRACVVKSVDTTTSQTGELIKYTVVYTKTGVQDAVYESKLHGDIDSALAVYKNMIIV